MEFDFWSFAFGGGVSALITSGYWASKVYDLKVDFEVALDKATAPKTKRTSTKKAA